MSRLRELLENRGENYILPFFWMHGEAHDVLRREIQAVYDCGIRALCVESRPHPDFAGPHWWSDMDLIMAEARKREMRVWVLDDKKFPTGFANGAYEAKPDKAKWYLGQRNIDLMGPAQNGSLLVAPLIPADGRILSILACPRRDLDSAELDVKAAIDLTDCVHDGFIYFTLPKGAYRLFLLFSTQTGGGRAHYMNLIDAESVQVQIDAVYEPHFARYEVDFGKTFAGFFSDEPELGNTPGYDFHDVLGKPDVRLPWSCALEAALKKAWGDDFYKNLPALWYGAGAATPQIRYDYMDAMTALVWDCFTKKVAGWCEERGVEYIGHTIEDDNAHARMGCSVGHYFREMAPRHMGGVDVVHFQILPGFTGAVHRWLGWETDGEFFHFALAKLGSSAAWLDPHKKGRTMCEIFGNYGWAEGVDTMKWLCDHMLARGINHFVPHAFSPTYPDRDCPPHFYAGGNNPQYPYFKKLMPYLNRMAHLLSGGRPHVDAAVLYHGENEWSGGEAMLCQTPLRALMENQLEAHIVALDYLEGARIENKKLVINGNEYAALILPYAEYMPPKLAAFIPKALAKGLPILAVGGLPKGDEAGCRSVTLKALPEAIRALTTPAAEVEGFFPQLRMYCVEREGETVHFFFNEGVDAVVETTVRIPTGHFTSLGRYDAVNNRLESLSMKDNAYALRLAPGESAAFILTAAACKGTDRRLARAETLAPAWTVSACTHGDYPQFSKRLTIGAGEALPNLNAPEACGPFTGHFRYSGSFAVSDMAAALWLRLPEIGGCADVRINGQATGTILGRSGYLEITDLVKAGDNLIEIDTASTLVWERRDGASCFIQNTPTGVTSPPVIEYFE